MRSVSGRQNDIAKKLAEPLVNGECDYLEWWYVHVPARTARTADSDALVRWRRVPAVGRLAVAGSGVSGPARGWFRLHTRAGAWLLAAALLGGCSVADAATRPATTVKRRVTTRRATMKPKVVATTTKLPATTSMAPTAGLSVRVCK